MGRERHQQTRHRPKTWERQDGESPQAFDAFRIYRDMGVQRSTAKVARHVGKAKQVMDRWSSRHEWVRRVEAWERELDQRRLGAAAREVERMRERHIRIAEGLQGVGVAELQKLVNSARQAGRSLSVDQVLRVLREGTTMERLNRGQPGEIVGHSEEGEVDLSGMTEDELLELRRLTAKARNGSGQE